MTSKPTGTIIVTGANGGLGSALVTKVIKEDGPYHSIFTVRGRSAASSGTVEKLLASVPAPSSSKYEIAELDLSSLTAVRKFAFDISSRVQSGEIPPIRSLVLNAGLQVFKGIKNTEDGYEITFAVNYLANFLLVLLLLKSMDLEHGRIVIVSSFTHDPEFWINASWRPKDSKYMFDEPEKMVHPDPPPPNLDLYIFGMRLYGRSKLLMIMFMYELQRRLNKDPKLSNISILAVDPGGMSDTSITRDAPSYVRGFVWLLNYISGIIIFFFPKLPLRTTAQSASDLYYASFDEHDLGTLPKAVNLNGHVKEDTSEESRDEEKQRKLWRESVKLAGLKSGDTLLSDWQ